MVSFPANGFLLSRKIRHQSVFIKFEITFKGSRKNKFAISGVQAPGRQGVKTKEYQAYYVFSQRSRAGCMGALNVKLLLREP